MLPYGLGRLWHDFWRRGIEDGAAQVIREVFPTGSDSASAEMDHHRQRRLGAEVGPPPEQDLHRVQFDR